MTATKGAGSNWVTCSRSWAGRASRPYWAKKKGGVAGIITSLIAQGHADKLVAIVAPRVMSSVIDTIGDLGTRNVDQALRLSFDRIYKSGDDLVIEARRRVAD